MSKQIEQENKTAVRYPVWSILGITAAAAMATLIIYSIPDIKRYIRITTM